LRVPVSFDFGCSLFEVNFCFRSFPVLSNSDKFQYNSS
jgi:hypothetical protein